MNRKLATGFYVPTERFKSISEHIAVMFEDDQTLVAVVGPSDERADLVVESHEYARLFSVSPEMQTALQEIEEKCDEAMGDWSPVSVAYLPADMEAYYQIRQIARDVLAMLEEQS